MLAPSSFSALAPLGRALAAESCKLQLLHLSQADLDAVQAYAQQLVDDADLEPRLAYSCALDKYHKDRAGFLAHSAPAGAPASPAAPVDLAEAWHWLEDVAGGDAEAQRAVDAAKKPTVGVSDLVSWMDSWGPSDADRALVAAERPRVAREPRAQRVPLAPPERVVEGVQRAQLVVGPAIDLLPFDELVGVLPPLPRRAGRAAQRWHLLR